MSLTQKFIMKETMREALRNHEKATKKTRDGASTFSSSRSAPRPINTTPPPAPLPTTSSSPNVRRKPIGTAASAPSSRVPSPAPSPVTRKPVGGGGSSSSRTTTTAASSSPSGASLNPTSSSSSTARSAPRNGAGFPSRAAWATAESAYLRDYARRHSTAARRGVGRKAAGRKGIVTMYREAPAGDGEVLGELVRRGWREWQERRRGEEVVEAEERRRAEHARRRDEGLVRWLEGRMEAAEAGALGELAGLGGGEAASSGEKEVRRREHRPSGSGHRRRHERSGSRTAPVRAGSTLYGYTKHTAYVHESTKPDDLDILVSKVTDKFSQWGKEFSDRAAEAKERKREERQRKKCEAVKKTISAPRPVDGSDDGVVDGELAKPGRGRPGVQLSARPSFGSEGSGRPLLDASKTSGSMAERMAKRSNGFEIPFWPRDKKDKKTSAASSAQASPQQQKYTLPRDEGYDRRGTQIGQFMDPPADLAAAPWNQHVNKANPFSPSHSKASSERDKSKHQQRSNSPSSFFSKFVPSPTSLFSSSSSSSSHHSSPSSPRQKLQRRGSDESFFGCVGISVDEERAAQPVHHRAREDCQLREPDFCAPPAAPEGVRELFARKSPPKLGQLCRTAGGGGGRTPFADSDDDDDDDDDDAKFDDACRQPPARVSPPLLLNAQHCPTVSDPAVDRHSMAAELVRGPSRGGQRGDDGRNTRASSSVVDDGRVSWWDPPSSSPSPPPKSSSRVKGKGRAGEAEAEPEVYTPPRQEWKEYWKDYRKKLRDPEFSRGSGWDEGRPF
ncbi:hypothetical protein SLS56_001900 [Neofusicoccum ribis]|uniref:Uncharacterized protein n=1 Tax=Neofusicoccum ribis TaxID=45134 RepID=A0ABR3T6Z6_9PEZI